MYRDSRSWLPMCRHAPTPAGGILRVDADGSTGERCQLTLGTALISIPASYDTVTALAEASCRDDGHEEEPTDCQVASHPAASWVAYAARKSWRRPELILDNVVAENGDVKLTRLRCSEGRSGTLSSWSSKSREGNEFGHPNTVGRTLQSVGLFVALTLMT